MNDSYYVSDDKKTMGDYCPTLIYVKAPAPYFVYGDVPKATEAELQKNREVNPELLSEKGV